MPWFELHAMGKFANIERVKPKKVDKVLHNLTILCVITSDGYRLAPWFA